MATPLLQEAVPSAGSSIIRARKARGDLAMFSSQEALSLPITYGGLVTFAEAACCTGIRLLALRNYLEKTDKVAARVFTCSLFTPCNFLHVAAMNDC